MNRRLFSNAARLAPVAISAIVLSSSGPLSAEQVTLAWDPNSEPDLAGYRLHYGTSAGAYSHIVDVGNVTTNTITDLQAGSTYWFVATAYNTSGLESDPSNEISYTVPTIRAVDGPPIIVLNPPMPQPTPTPTISALDAQQVEEDAVVGPVPFTVGDVDSDPGSLTVTASSGNLALVPQANVVLGGSGADRTLTATPGANAHGSATITLTVNDGQAAATTSFLLTVTPVNDPPTISNLPDQQTTMHAPAGPIVFTIADLETDPDQLAVSAVSGNPVLAPATGIALTGTGADRTLTVTPAPDQAGTATITVSVSDGAATVSASFVLTVNSSLPPPWSAEDIGAPNLAGSTFFDGTTFRVAGGGTGIEGRADQFHFAWQPLSGDGEITARVVSIEDPGLLAEAGVMIRETLDGNSRHTLMCVTPGKGFYLLHRGTTADITTSRLAGTLYPISGNWVRLVRKGNTIRAFKSGNGSTWAQVGWPVQSTAASQIYVGLAVTACNGLQRYVATFDNVVVVP